MQNLSSPFWHGTTAVCVVGVIIVMTALGLRGGQAEDDPKPEAQNSAAIVHSELDNLRIKVDVPESPEEKSRWFAYDYACAIQPDGKIGIRISRLRGIDSTFHPFEWQWKSLRVTPELGGLEVDQTVEDGKITNTDVAFFGVLRIEGEAHIQRNVELVPGYDETIYGPPVKVSQQVIIRGELFRSRDIPQLNSIPKARFRAGELSGDSMKGMEAGGIARSVILHVQGNVSVQREGKLLKAKPGMEVFPGDEIRAHDFNTQVGEVTIALAGTAVIKLSSLPNIHGSVMLMTEGVTTPGDFPKINFLKMARGVLWANAKRTDDSLKVSTPSAVLGVRNGGPSASDVWSVKMSSFVVHVPEEKEERTCIWSHVGKLRVLLGLDANEADRRVIMLNEGESICLTGDRSEPAPTRLPVEVRVLTDKDGKQAPVTGAQVTLSQSGKPAAVSEAVSDSHGFAHLNVADAGTYQAVASARGFLPEKAVSVSVVKEKPARLDILLKRDPAALPEPPVPSPIPLPPTNCTFAGLWKVYFYDNEAGTGTPPEGINLKVVVNGDQATGYSGAWGGTDQTEFCRGPLSQNGQIWNAKRYANGEVSLHFDNVHFDPDCNRFVGKWSGEAPHNYAWVGVRINEVKPPGPLKRNVELTSQQRSQTIDVTPGSTITVKVATSTSTGYQMQMAPVTARGLTVSGPRDEPMSRVTPGGKSKVVVGAGVWKVYEVKVNDEAAGEQQLKFAFFRTAGKVDYEYVLTLRASDTP